MILIVSINADESLQRNCSLLHVPTSLLTINQSINQSISGFLEWPK